MFRWACYNVCMLLCQAKGFITTSDRRHIHKSYRLSFSCWRSWRFQIQHGDRMYVTMVMTARSPSFTCLDLVSRSALLHCALPVLPVLPGMVLPAREPWNTTRDGIFNDVTSVTQTARDWAVKKWHKHNEILINRGLRTKKYVRKYLRFLQSCKNSKNDK